MSFWRKNNPEKVIQEERVVRMRVVVTSFAGSSKYHAGKSLMEILKKDKSLDVIYYNDSPSAEQQKMNSRNVSGLRDFSVNVFKKTEADVIIFMHQENDLVCLNFLAYGEYDELNVKYWSLLDCLYLPAYFFESAETLQDVGENLIKGALLLSAKSRSKEDEVWQKNELKEIVKFFENDNSTGKISVACMPYILSLISSIYFACAQDKADKTTLDTVKYMMEKALQSKDNLFAKIHIAPMYVHLGNLFYFAAQNMNVDTLVCYNKATQAYRLAKNYLTKEEYPYDYAQLSYVCAGAYFSQWRYTDNLDSLRDAVGALHDAEKIYTEKLFPASWAKIQHELGWYLSLLGSYGNSPEILNLSIKNYKNAQKIFYAEKFPFIWLSIQADIGRVYYAMGKQYQDLDALKSAEKCFKTALFLCEEKKAEEQRRKIDADMAKTIALMYTIKNQ